MFEVVLYATLATIVCVVLYSVLGQQVGRGPDEGAGPEDIFGTTRDMDEPRANLRGGSAPVLAAAPTVGAQATPVDRLRARDPEFDPRVFIDQATTAYGMVLEAYASGDRDTLGMLLTPEVNALYAKAIDDRERQDLTQVTDILRIADAEIEGVDIAGDQAQVEVKFTSEIASALVDSVGQPVLGDPDLVANVSEVWTFVRDLGSDDPAWLLSDVAPEEGDALPADPAPDTKG